MVLSRLRVARANLMSRKGRSGGPRRFMLLRGKYMRSSRKQVTNQKVYTYKYKTNGGTVGIGAGVAFNYNAIDFSLQAIPNYAELTALYDEYQIAKVDVEFIPRAAPLSQAISTATTGNANQLFGTCQPFLTVIDYDDSSVPTTRNELLQYGTCKVMAPNKYFKRSIVPKIAVQTYKTSLTTGYAAKAKQWLDCADDTVPHFGLKWCWDQDANAVSTILYDIYVTYHMKFRGTR